MAAQWFSNMVMDEREPGFFHQWQQPDEQVAAAAFGKGEMDVDLAAAQKAAKVNTSWDSCTTGDQGSPADSYSPTAILSFGGHGTGAGAGAMFAKAQAAPGATCYGASAAVVTMRAPKQEVDAAVTPAQLAQPRPAKRSYDAMATAASQNQEHILAERKRREKLSQRFIALSKIVPGLKKMDKATVLGDAIRYVKQLQEQVKGLEDEARRRPVEAAVLVKKSWLSAAAADEDDGSSCDENAVAGTRTTALPEIEARVSDRTVLVRIHCENRKGALVTALSEVERIGLATMSINVLPFTSSSLDITVVAKAGEDFCLSAKDVVKELNQSFKASL
ncbi:hypothetical protein ACP4OV_005586 [Aristida adscensionis]